MNSEFTMAAQIPLTKEANAFRESKITSKMKDFIGNHLTKEWRKLGRRLLDPKGDNFAVESMLDGIFLAHPGNAQEWTCSVLNEWQKQFPDDATVGNLMTALEEIGLKQVASLFVEHFSEDVADLK